MAISMIVNIDAHELQLYLGHFKYGCSNLIFRSKILQLRLNINPMALYGGPISFLALLIIRGFLPSPSRAVKLALDAKASG